MAGGHHIPYDGTPDPGVEEQLRLAIEAGQLGIWDWDIPGDRVTWSPRVYELHGVAPGGFGGRVQDFAALVHPDDAPRVQEMIERALRGELTYAIEFRVPLPDGRIRWLATRAEILRDGTGRPVRMVGATYDATDRVELLAAERAARSAAEEARKRFELLAAAGELFSRSLEPRETLQAIATLLVPRVCDWCRIDLVDADGTLQRAVTHHSDPEKARHGAELAAKLRAAPGQVGSMAWAVETGQAHTAHFDPPLEFDQMRDRDLLTFSQAIGLRAYFILPLVSRGRTLGALAALQAESGRPITEGDRTLIAGIAQRAAVALDNARLYAETEAARRQAEAANRAKDEFLAMLGHELRNPLAPIVNALEVMDLRGDGGVEERRIIGRQLGHLSRLVDDLLDVSRIAQGKVKLERARVDMKAVVAQALELTQPMHAVETDLTTRPAYVEGDSVRLVQVLCNLLGNAAKYTPPEGRITLRLSTSGAGVVASVRDTGIGIAPHLLPRVFDAFQQGDLPLDRKTGGLGLGLAIVKTLVEMHGGSVTAESKGPGQGSQFTVTLPAAAEQVPAAPQAPDTLSAAAGGRLLVVDDNADAASMLALLLGELGYEARAANDGAAALAQIGGFVPDAAILDIGLPDMDGYALARSLKSDPRLAGIKLVAVTGYGGEADRARALAGGFDEHLVKPVSAARMLEVLQALVTAPKER